MSEGNQIPAGAVVVDEEGNIVESKVPTGAAEGGAGTGEGGADEGGAAEGGADEGGAAEGGAGDDHDEDLTDTETEAEREEIRKRRREERHFRKQRQREREDRYQREIAARDVVIDEMRQRLDLIERRGAGADMAQLESAIKQSSDAYNYYKGQIAEAASAQNGQLVAEATEKMMLAGQRLNELARIKKAYQGNAAAPRTPAMDPRVVNKAEEWTNKNRWYDPNGRDEDSRLVLDIDRRIMEDGFDPRTPQYWDELDARIKKYLPHRTNSGHNNSQGRETGARSPVASSGKQGAAGNGSGATFVLSPERVQAIKDAGKWEDPAERARMIKTYRDYDREHNVA